MLLHYPDGENWYCLRDGEPSALIPDICIANSVCEFIDQYLAWLNKSITPPNEIDVTVLSDVEILVNISRLGEPDALYHFKRW